MKTNRFILSGVSGEPTKKVLSAEATKLVESFTWDGGIVLERQVQAYPEFNAYYEKHILENKIIHGVLSAVVNIFRSIPFLILLVFLIPVTRFLTGSSIGTTATIVPLTVGAIPIVARLVESSLKEVPSGIVEAAQAMGASPWQIIVRFLIMYIYIVE